MLQECYTTERLSLLLAKPSLAPRVLDYYERNRAFLKPYESARDASFFTQAYHKRFLELEHARAAEGTAARFFLTPRGREQGEIIGLVALGNIYMGSFCSAFLAYNLDERYGGQGLMTEALTKLIELAFGTLGLHRLEANIMPWNKRSIDLVKRLGFANEGLARQYFEINGAWEDHIHMVLLNGALPPRGAV